MGRVLLTCMARKSSNGGCGCLLMLLFLGGGGYWGYSLFSGSENPTNQIDVSSARQELSTKEINPSKDNTEQQRGANEASSELVVHPKIQCADDVPMPDSETEPISADETQSETDFEAVSISVDETQSETDSDTELPPADEAQFETGISMPELTPTVEEDYAPDTLNGKCLLCSYQDAEMASRLVDEDSDFSPFTPIIDNGKGYFSTDVGDIPMLRRLSVFTTRTLDSAPKLLKYCRTDKNTAEVQIIALMIPDAEAAQSISNVVASIDSLSMEQIYEEIGQYFLDCSDSLKLTFTGKNTATAEGEYSAGTVENKMRGLKVQLVDGMVDAVSPESAEIVEAPVAEEDRSSLDPLISRMRALRCRQSDSALYQKRLLTLLPMIRDGADVNLTLPETKGNTALHYSCAIGSLSITTWLLEHGANPNAVTHKGATPLKCVGSDNREAIIRVLRQYGAQ